MYPHHATGHNLPRNIKYQSAENHITTGTQQSPDGGYLPRVIGKQTKRPARDAHQQQEMEAPMKALEAVEQSVISGGVMANENGRDCTGSMGSIRIGVVINID